MSLSCNDKKECSKKSIKKPQNHAHIHTPLTHSRSYIVSMPRQHESQNKKAMGGVSRCTRF